MKALRFIYALLPSLFWGLIIFGFEKPYAAIITLLCALIHECGHLLMLPEGSGIRCVLSGFRIKPGGMLSYRQRLVCYLGGPMANLATALFFLAFSMRGNEYLRDFALLSGATGLSNLLPIEGYDGYGILLTLADMCSADRRIYSLLRVISLFIIILLTIFSLCLMDKIGEGYWIFAVFFSGLIKSIDKSLSR